MQSIAWHRHPWLNHLQTALLILALLIICVMAGNLLLGEQGVWLALTTCVFALIFEPGAAWRLTLRFYGARPIYPSEAPMLWQILTVLSERAQLPNAPTPYYIPSPLMNAFAVGNRKQSAIALTDGLLKELSPRELAGVLAHETAHIANNDLRVMGLADSVSRITALLAITGQLFLLLTIPLLFLDNIDFEINWPAVLLLLLAPHLTVLVQLGLSRTREYDADLNAALLTRDPQGLAMALAKIEQTSRFWLSVLLPGWGNPEPSWLRSHPATAKRIRRLQELTPEIPHPDWNGDWQEPVYRGRVVVIGAPRWYIGGLWR